MAKLKIVKKKKAKNKSNPVGRPPLYKTPQALQKKIEEYFKKGRHTRKVLSNGKLTELPFITISDLVLYLGFCDRHSFYDLEKQEKFSHTIKRARSFIEREYEEQLQLCNVAGAIFALKNFGWTDKTELEHSGKDGGPIEQINLSKKEYEEIRKKMIKNDDI